MQATVLYSIILFYVIYETLASLLIATRGWSVKPVFNSCTLKNPGIYHFDLIILTALRFLIIILFTISYFLTKYLNQKILQNKQFAVSGVFSFSKWFHYLCQIAYHLINILKHSSILVYLLFVGQFMYLGLKLLFAAKCWNVQKYWYHILDSSNYQYEYQKIEDSDLQCLNPCNIENFLSLPGTTDQHQLAQKIGIEDADFYHPYGHAHHIFKLSYRKYIWFWLTLSFTLISIGTSTWLFRQLFSSLGGERREFCKLRKVLGIGYQRFRNEDDRGFGLETISMNIFFIPVSS